VAVTTPDGGWAELCGALPDHASEVMAGYRPSPTIAEQDRTHGAGLPAEDRGHSGQEKYGGAG
jgi:hypothetical protein